MTTKSSDPSTDRISLAILWLLILAFILTFATLSLRRHAALSTNGLDLGNMNQALWNTAHGDFLAFTNNTHIAPINNRLAVHVEPILLLFVPFYWLGLGGPELLLIVQAVIVGLGALPVYWLARNAILNPKSPTSALRIFGIRPVPVAGTGREAAGSSVSYLESLLPLVFPLGYLLLPALEAGVMYDFHPVTLVPTFFLFAFYYLEKDRPWMFGLFVALAVSCKEDMGLTAAMLGIYLIIARRRWRLGGMTMVAGTVWFLVALFLIQAPFSPEGPNIQADRYAWMGETPSGIINTWLHRPHLVWDHVWQQANLPGYLSGLLLPTAFLSALSPLVWLPILPSFAINLLSSNPFTWRLEDFHYAAPIVPFVFIASIYGVQRLMAWASLRSQRAARYVLVAACCLLLIASLTYHYARGFSPLARPFNPWPISDHDLKARQVFAQVPATAALFAQDNLNPHLSSRRVLYQGPVLLTDPIFLEGLPAPDYLLFDVSSLVNQDNFHRFIASNLLVNGSFGPLVADDGFLLLERGASPAPLPQEFFNFVRAKPDEIDYPLEVDFGDALRLHGFDLNFNRAEEVQPTLYFEALRPLDEDYFLSLYLLDQWDTPLGATIEDQPALVWYPTGRWQPGELIKVTFNTLPWYTRDLPSYRLAVGVMQGHDPWQPAARLSPASSAEENKSYAIRLPAGGTLLELARFRQRFDIPIGGPVEHEYRRPRVQTALDVSLGEDIQLLGYDMGPIICDVDACWLGLILYWQAQRPIEVDYTVFVHIVRPGDQGVTEILGQRDTIPNSGAYPTKRWATGEVVVDPIRVALPPDIPAGMLEVIAGMYRSDNGQRLPVLNAKGDLIDDKVVLGNVTRSQ